jgi:hypothetical protein
MLIDLFLSVGPKPAYSSNNADEYNHTYAEHELKYKHSNEQADGKHYAAN